MLITLSVTFVSLLVLMAEIAQADITLKLNAHTTHSDTSPRSRAIGRSRPRRQGTAADHGIEARQAGSQIASPIDHAPIILNSPGGIISTVDLQIANVTLPFLVCLPDSNWLRLTSDRQWFFAVLGRNSGLS